MLQYLRLRCALIGVLFAISCLCSVLGMKANVLYKDVSGATPRFFNVRQVKQVSENLNSWIYAPIGNQKDRKGHRFARAAGNKTAVTTQPPTVFTPKNVSTNINSIPPNSSIPQNSTETSFHKYYSSRFVENVDDFEDLKALYDAPNTSVSMQNFTNSKPDHIYYNVQKLKFRFPFYGHDVEQAVLTSAGFIHIGPILHQFLHDVHYIAPLMGDFFSNPGRPVIVYILSGKTRVVCQWESVFEGGVSTKKPFTFQVTLFLNGTIMFTYMKIPYSVTSFKSKNFPPKVGMSDGFVRTKYYKILVNGKILRLPVKTIYRYHTVSLDKDKIKSHSAYILSPVPNCIQAKTCNECFSKVIAKNFKCKWCKKLQLCSDEFDWHRQDWFEKGCNTQAYSSEDQCSSKVSPGSKKCDKQANSSEDKCSSKVLARSSTGSKTIVGVVIGVVLLILVLCIAGLLIYGYRNPTSRIGTMMKNCRNPVPFKTFK